MDKLAIIDGPRLISCNFQRKDGVKPQEKPVPISCEYLIELKAHKENKSLLAYFTAKTDDVSLPFSFDVKAATKFTFNDNIITNSEVELNALKGVAPYLFIFLREFVADLTRKAYFKTFYLPNLEITPELIRKENAVEQEKAE